MQIAFISDIHGDNVALQAALARIALYAPDTIVCLGDVAQGGPQPRETVEALRELGCPVLIGNADHWLITGAVADDSTESEPSLEQEEVRLWTLEQLGEENIKFLGDCPFSLEVPLTDDATVCCVHATLRSFNEVILPETPEEEIAEAFKDTAARIATGGHTHRQWIRSWSDRLFFNPGSVGLAYDRHVFDEGRNPTAFIDPWAEFAVLTTSDGGLALDFGKAPVNSDEVKNAIAHSGRPHAENAAAAYRSY